MMVTNFKLSIHLLYDVALRRITIIYVVYLPKMLILNLTMQRRKKNHTNLKKGIFYKPIGLDHSKMLKS